MLLANFLNNPNLGCVLSFYVYMGIHEDNFEQHCG